MKNGVNIGICLGNLGQDPQMRFTPNGTPVTNFSVAVNRTYRDGQGQTHEETEWFDVVAWGKLGELVNQYAGRGSRVFVEGRFKTRTWEQDGVRRSKKELVANEVKFLDGPRAEAVVEDVDDDTAEGYSDLPF